MHFLCPLALPLEEPLINVRLFGFPYPFASHKKLYKFVIISPNATIDEDDLFDLLDALMPIVASWKAIGEGLRLRVGSLEEIKKANHDVPRECMSEMLKCWLRRNYNVRRFGVPTWRTVVKVVADPAAGNNCSLALRIAEKHPGKFSFAYTASLTSSHHPVNQLLTTIRGYRLNLFSNHMQ